MFSKILVLVTGASEFGGEQLILVESVNIRLAWSASGAANAMCGSEIYILEQMRSS